MPTEETSTTTTAIQEPQAKQEPANKVRKIIKFLNGKKVIKRTCGDGYRYAVSYTHLTLPTIA